MERLGVVIALLVPSLCGAADLGAELLTNGTFEAGAGDRPAGWSWDGATTWVADGDRHFVAQEAATPATRSIGQLVPLEERYWKLRLACRVRVTEVKLGQEGWHDARIAMQFQDAAGQMVGAWPNVLHFTGSMADWEAHTRDFVVPDGAAQLSLSCSLFSTTGKVEWDDLSLTVLRFDPVPEDATLPEGVVARWDLANAYREESPTRGRVCLNGLWRFHPVALTQAGLPGPGTGWGYLKVPGTWAPGVSRQTPYGPDIWEQNLDLRATDAAWYQRRFDVPAAWVGRRVLLNVDNPKHSARVLVDGREAGRIEWPGGRLDVTDLVQPGRTHELSVYALALPLQEEQLVVMGPDKIEAARATVRFKGLCGDCWLESEPPAARITDVFIKPSVRNHELRVQCELTGLDPRGRYRLAAVALDGEEIAQSFAGEAFSGTDRIEFAGAWENPRLWDLDQPNLYTLLVKLQDEDGKLVDQTTPVRFGFREFEIRGKDFHLNGTPIHLRCLDYLNAGDDFGLASYAMARHTLAQARALGFNYVIHSNYDYEPQSVTCLDDTVRAGDEAGFPMSFSIRHVKDIYRDFEDPQKRAYWDRVVDYEVRRFRNHPSVLMWAMNHNFTGWADDQNPQQLHGRFEPSQADNEWLYQVRRAALLAEQRVMALDGTRPCYHHQSGPFSQMITLNCYLNWTPLQERMEWISRWRSEGIKPLFFVEFGLPHQASWGSHREGPFIWTNDVSSEPWATEFAAIHNGDGAYDLTADEVKHYETIERVYATGQPFHLSQVLASYWSERWEHNFLEIKSRFTAETWPAFRTYGVSAILPWDQADLFKPVPGAQGQDVRVKTDWDALQRPGLAPDVVAWNTDWLTCPEPQGAIVPTSLGETFARVNRDTLAYIAGAPERFTAQDHVFRSGEASTKQIVLLNDLRREAEFQYQCTFEVGGKSTVVLEGSKTVPPGGKAVVPLTFTLPKVKADTAGRLTLVGKLDGKPDPTLEDAFDLTVLPAPADRAAPWPVIACYDPKGLTSVALQRLGVPVSAVTQPVAPKGASVLIIGREAISLQGPAVDLPATLKSGVTAIVFEQTEEVLQKLWGFRTASPGTRHVYVRQPAHPVCRGLTDELLRDWRGSGTLLEAYPERTGYSGRYPRQEWCGFDNSRTWQWGNFGTVASVVVEKPQRGNYSYLLDCEFDLQYTPLFEWLTDGGRAIFCQLDLSGRDGDDPVADRVLSGLVQYAATATRPRLGGARYVGDEQTRRLLEDLGADLTGTSALIVGPGADRQQALAAISGSNNVVCLRLSGEELARLPIEVKTEKRTVTHTRIGRPTEGALLGLGNSEFHWRGHIPIEAIAQAPEGFRVADTGVFAEGVVDGRHYTLCQFSPLMFDYSAKIYQKLTFRRAALALTGILTNRGIALHSRIGDKLAQPRPADVDLAGQWRLTADPQSRLSADEVSQPDFDDSGWYTVTVPGTWESQVPQLADYDGVVWYRKAFTLEKQPSRPVDLLLGAVDDEDWTYLNGKLVGHLGQDTNPDDYWSAPRRYETAPDDLRAGANVLVVKVNDLRQTAGIVTGPVALRHPPAWLDSYYLDMPTNLDDPYRYERW